MRVRTPASVTRAFVACIALCALAAGCASPIGVERVSPEQVQRKLTGSVLSTGKLSGSSRNVFRRANLLEVFKSDPEVALAAGYELLMNRRSRWQTSELGPVALVAMAEGSFLHASNSGDRRYFVMTAVYAWAFLFGGQEFDPIDPIDPLVRLAANLYNRGLTLALLTDDAKASFELAPSRLELPIGELELELDPEQLRWGKRVFTAFTPVADLRIRGLTNRYRVSGLGAPVAATTRLADEETEAGASTVVYDETRVPLSLVLVFDDIWRGLETGKLRGHVEIVGNATRPVVSIGGRDYSGELEPSASLALMLAEAAPWRNELRALFEGDLKRESDGLKTLSLHRPGRIPVILVHGTASSPATWANLLNDLMSDAEIQSRYEFWLFTYNTGAPVLYSAALLRAEIADLVHAIDPDGTDPALRRTVVVGHSQGGLLTKLQVVESGDLFWQQISEEPFEDLKMKDETRKLIQDAIFIEPSPYVERVVFIATPHRGSFLLTYGITNLIRNLVDVPTTVVRATGDLVTQNPEAEALRRIDDTEGSLSQMNPDSRFLANLLSLPVVPGVAAHSIIAVRRFGPKDEETDGVVEYQSAHLDDVESEVLVQSGHSCLDHPFVVEEVRRILLMHALPRRIDSAREGAPLSSE